MAVLLKRSNKHMPMECRWGCCSEIYGKNTAKVRRRLKRAERRRWQAWWSEQLSENN